MRFLLVVALVGCGPYTPNVVGRTCDAGVKEQSCSSPTDYVACSGGIWREYPCTEACDEGGKCPLFRHGDSCAPSWNGTSLCKSAKVALSCVDGAWEQWGCEACPAGQVCYSFACNCT